MTDQRRIDPTIGPAARELADIMAQQDETIRELTSIVGHLTRMMETNKKALATIIKTHQRQLESLKVVNDAVGVILFYLWMQQLNPSPIRL